MKWEKHFLGPGVYFLFEGCELHISYEIDSTPIACEFSVSQSIVNRASSGVETSPFHTSAAGTSTVDGSVVQELSRRSNLRITAIAAGCLIAVLLVAIYFRIATKLVTDWYEIPDYSHGFLVPFFSAFILWDKRKTLEATPIKPSWAGLPLVIIGVLTVVFGVYGAELFLSRVSFILILAGMTWMFCGRAMLREVRLPLAVLLLAVPFPEIVFNQITFPLQLFASRVASGLLPLLGVPVFREGNVIQLPVMKLEVAQACSGIRSLMSLFTLAVFYGYFLEKTTARRWFLALASIPIAVAANSLRIVGTGLCVQYWDPSKGEGFFHEFSGWVMFVISLSLLYLLHRAMLIVLPSRKTL